MTWQGVYKHGKSCADIVWAQRMMISDVSRKPWSYHKMGLDMSRAFDTVKRDTIVNLFRESWCWLLEWRHYKVSPVSELSNTKLKVRTV